MIAFLKARTRQRDRERAVIALRSSPNVYDRGVAALILANFGSRDDTWYALAEALRESDGMVSAIAAQTLDALSAQTRRRIAWHPAASGLHAMLDGTSLFALPTLIEVLIRTDVGPANAGSLLRGGGDMLLAYLTSANPALSEPSHRLLIRLRGADLGRDQAPWKLWIAGL